MSWLSKWLRRRRPRRRAPVGGRRAPGAMTAAPVAAKPAPSAPAPPVDDSWKQIWRRFQPPPGVTAERLLAEASNDMERLYYAHQDRKVTKWHHYLEVYDRHLARFRGTPVRLVEIGLDQGGSLQLWRQYLGPAAVVHGVDRNQRCALIDDPDLTVHVGDQADRALLDRVHESMGGIDVVIDDGGHVCADQIATFLALFPKLSDFGVYICEDLHTSYWRHFGGGRGAAGTFIEFLKETVDGMHARYFEEADAGHGVASPPGVFAVSFYDSIAVIEKRPDRSPFWLAAGVRDLPGRHQPVAS